MSSLHNGCCSLALVALLTLPTVTFAEEPSRIVPAFQDGKPSGFKLVRLTKGSRLEALGLESGDIVDAVDGKPVRAPGEMQALLQRVEAGEHPALTVLRDGVRQQLP